MRQLGYLRTRWARPAAHPDWIDGYWLFELILSVLLIKTPYA